MRLPCVLPLTLVAMGVQLRACAEPKAAVVYCSWGGYAFRDEFDPHLQHLGWPYEKFENTRIADLVDRLDEFDVVISAGVGNLEHPVDMAPYAADWLRFLQSGGLLWITDASYAPVLDLWTNRLGPEYVLTSTPCAFHRRDKPQPELMVFDEGAPLLHAPNELPPLLANKTNIWAHLDSWGPAWTSLVTCADGKSLMVYSDVGQGCILVSSYYSFKGPAATPVATAILRNLWARGQGLRKDLAVTRFSLGEARPGQNGFVLDLTCPNGAQYQVDLHVSEPGLPARTYSTQLAVPGDGTQLGQLHSEMVYELTRRGDVRFELTIARGGQPMLTLTRQHSIPPVVSVSLGNRHYYPWQTELGCNASFAPDTANPLAECVAEMLVDDDVKGVRAELQADMPMAVDISSLGPGEHRVAVRLKHAGTTLGEAQERFVTHSTPRVYIRPQDGTTIADGKPFFPFGWYHVSWSETAEHRLDFLRSVATGGFNTVHAGIKQLDEWDEFLSEAERLQVRVITEFGIDMFSVIARYCDRWPVLAWNPGDEPDAGGVDPRVMLDRHNAIKDVDPQVPTFMTLCVPQSYARYVHAAEVIAPDPYPIRHASASTVPVYETLTQARSAAWKLGRPIWAILQCFGYDDPSSWRVPTFAEVRNMTYLALLAGAKGILYYTYFDPGFDMTQHPELWLDMCTLPAEMKALEPWTLGAEPTALDTGFPDVFAAYWISADGPLVCVVNTAPAESRTLHISLPAAVTGEPVNLFPARGGEINITQGRMTGEIAPLAVHVCRLR